MQKLIGLMRKAIQKYDMIQPGDRIAVGVSGGKDSVALLAGLAKLREFMGIDYEIVAITLDYRFGGVDSDFSELQKLCDELKVEYIVKPTEIGQIIFDIRKEKAEQAVAIGADFAGLSDEAYTAGKKYGVVYEATGTNTVFERGLPFLKWTLYFLSSRHTVTSIYSEAYCVAQEPRPFKPRENS